MSQNKNTGLRQVKSLLNVAMIFVLTIQFAWFEYAKASMLTPMGAVARDGKNKYFVFETLTTADPVSYVYANRFFHTTPGRLANGEVASSIKIFDKTSGQLERELVMAAGALDEVQKFSPYKLEKLMKNFKNNPGGDINAAVNNINYKSAFTKTYISRIPAIFKNSIMRFPIAAASFFIAIGANVAADLVLKHNDNPVAWQEFFDSQEQGITHLSFWMFMLASGLVSEPLSIMITNPKAAKLIPYMGMSTGMVASNITHEIAAVNKDMNGCYKSMMRPERPIPDALTPACDGAFKAWVGDNGFEKIQEWSPGLMSLLLSVPLAAAFNEVAWTGIRATGKVVAGSGRMALGAAQATKAKVLIRAIEVGSWLVPGTGVAKGIRFVAEHLVRDYGFIASTNFLDKPVVGALENKHLGGALEKQSQLLMASIIEKKKNGWVLTPSEFEACEDLLDSCRHDILGEMDRLDYYVSQWTRLNLQDAMDAHGRWMSAVGGLSAQYRKSHEFYGYFTESLYFKAAGLWPKDVKIIDRPYLLNGIFAKDYTEELLMKNLYVQPDEVEKKQIEYVQDVLKDYRTEQRLPVVFLREEEKDYLLKPVKDFLVAYQIEQDMSEAKTKEDAAKAAAEEMKKQDEAEAVALAAVAEIAQPVAALAPAKATAPTNKSAAVAAAPAKPVVTTATAPRAKQSRIKSCNHVTRDSEGKLQCADQVATKPAVTVAPSKPTAATPVAPTAAKTATTAKPEVKAATTTPAQPPVKPAPTVDSIMTDLANQYGYAQPKMPDSVKKYSELLKFVAWISSKQPSSYYSANLIESAKLLQHEMQTAATSYLTPKARSQKLMQLLGNYIFRQKSSFARLNETEKNHFLNLLKTLEVAPDKEVTVQADETPHMSATKKIAAAVSQLRLISMGFGIQSYSRSYKNAVIELLHTLSNSREHIPNPIRTPGLGFVTYYQKDKDKGLEDQKDYQRYYAPTRLGGVVVHFESAAESYLGGMLFGPDVEKGEPTVTKEEGYPAKFNPPKIVMQSPQSLRYNNPYEGVTHHPGQRKAGLMEMSTLGKDGKRISLYDYLRDVSNVKPTVVDTVGGNVVSQDGKTTSFKHNGAQFSQWWEENVFPDYMDAWKFFEKDYQSILYKFKEGLFGKKQEEGFNLISIDEFRRHRMNNGPLENSVLSSSLQIVKMQLSLMGEVFRDAYRKNRSTDKPTHIPFKNPELREVKIPADMMTEPYKTVETGDLKVYKPISLRDGTYSVPAVGFADYNGYEYSKARGRYLTPVLAADRSAQIPVFELLRFNDALELSALTKPFAQVLANKTFEAPTGRNFKWQEMVLTNFQMIVKALEAIQPDDVINTETGRAEIKMVSFISADDLQKLEESFDQMYTELAFHLGLQIDEQKTVMVPTDDQRKILGRSLVSLKNMSTELINYIWMMQSVSVRQAESDIKKQKGSDGKYHYGTDRTTSTQQGARGAMQMRLGTPAYNRDK